MNPPYSSDLVSEFADKMALLTAQLAEQFAESAKLEEEIKKNLAGLGYAI